MNAHAQQASGRPLRPHDNHCEAVRSHTACLSLRASPHDKSRCDRNQVPNMDEGAENHRRPKKGGTGGQKGGTKPHLAEGNDTPPDIHASLRREGGRKARMAEGKKSFIDQSGMVGQGGRRYPLWNGATAHRRRQARFQCVPTEEGRTRTEGIFNAIFLPATLETERHVF